MTTATVIPGVLTFLLSTTPVPSVTPTPVPPAMATAKAKTDLLGFVLPTATPIPKGDLPEKWKEEVREYRKIRKWADEQEHMLRIAQNLLQEDADAYAWTARRTDVEPDVARTARFMADSMRQKARQLHEMEYLMLNVNVAATNAIKRRHQNPFRDDDMGATKRPWYRHPNLVVGVLASLVIFLCLLWIFSGTRSRNEDDKETPQK